MPPSLPNNKVYLTQQAMNDKFTNEGWDAMLQNWAVSRETKEWDPNHPLRRALSLVHETQFRYRDGDGNTRAFIIDYRQVDGTERRAVRMLRDDAGTQFDVETDG